MSQWMTSASATYEGSVDWTKGVMSEVPNRQMASKESLPQSCPVGRCERAATVLDHIGEIKARASAAGLARSQSLQKKRSRQ